MPKRPVREQLLIDNDVQVSLVMRALLYGAVCMTYFTVIQFFTQSLNHPGKSLTECLMCLADEAIYWVPGFLILGPLMVYDMLRISNRFAGPIFALRRQMQALIDRQPSRELTFRDDDHWDCLAAQFNQLRTELICLRQENEDLRTAQEMAAVALRESESDRAEADEEDPIKSQPTTDLADDQPLDAEDQAKAPEAELQTS